MELSEFEMMREQERVKALKAELEGLKQQLKTAAEPKSNTIEKLFFDGGKMKFVEMDLAKVEKQILADLNIPPASYNVRGTVTGRITSSSPAAEVNRAEIERHKAKLLLDHVRNNGGTVFDYLVDERQVHDETLLTIRTRDRVKERGMGFREMFIFEGNEPNSMREEGRMTCLRAVNMRFQTLCLAAGPNLPAFRIWFSWQRHPHDSDLVKEQLLQRGHNPAVTLVPTPHREFWIMTMFVEPLDNAVRARLK